MSEKWVQHIGDDQLVYGMPKHMAASSRLASSNATAQNGDIKLYWRYQPKPGACEKCQAMKGFWFEENPGPVHPNCKCEIQTFEAMKVTGRADVMIVPPGINLEASLAEARQVARECETRAQKQASQVDADFRAKSVEGILAFWYKCEWVFKNFKSGARYDFKKGGHPEYEDFGNYHYGLYTKAMGINVTFAQAAAGAWQLRQGTSDIDYSRSWFDDPRDNRRVREGQEYPMK